MPKSAKPSSPKKSKKPKSQNAKPKSQSAARSHAPAHLAQRSSVQLDRCMVKWMRMYEDPFSSGDGYCLPLAPAPPSNKMSTRIKGTVIAGTNRVGFIQVRPSAASDSPVAYWSTATFTGTATALTGTGVSSANNLQSALTVSNFVANGGSARQRLVLAAIRIRYTGTELSRGGTIYPWSYGDHSTTNGRSITEVNTMPSYTSETVNRSWHTIRFAPQYSWETNYSTEAQAVTEAGTAPASPEPGLAIIFDSTAGNSFEFEVVMHHEVIGGITGLTESMSSAAAPQIMSTVNDLGRGTAKSGDIFRVVAAKLPGVFDSIGLGKAVGKYGKFAEMGVSALSAVAPLLM